MSVYLVALPLRGRTCSEAIAELKCDHKFDKFVRSIGIPLEGGELKTVAYEQGPLVTVEVISPTIGTSQIEMMSLGRGAALVRRYEAQAAIALLDARIAALEEELSGYRAGLSELVAKEVAALTARCSMSGKMYTLESAPVGLLQTTDGVLILKTEYSDENGAIDAYIVESGEFFWGDHPQTPERQRNQVVHEWPVAAIYGSAHDAEILRGIRNVIDCGEGTYKQVYDYVAAALKGAAP